MAEMSVEERAQTLALSDAWMRLLEAPIPTPKERRAYLTPDSEWFESPSSRKYDDPGTRGVRGEGDWVALPDLAARDPTGLIYAN